MDVAAAILLSVGLYAGTGVVVATVFAVRGVVRVDPAARSASWAFRLLILPGAAALWPLVLRRWISAARDKGPPERSMATGAAGRMRAARRAHLAWWLVVAPISAGVLAGGVTAAARARAVQREGVARTSAATSIAGAAGVGGGP
jgi:glycerol uptake facilitator-like aquaporin